MIAIVLIVLVGSLAAWHWLAAPRPPVVSFGSNPDPAVVAAVTSARRRVLLWPRSGNTWGRFATVCYAHDYYEAAEVAFARAERLDPRNPRWPYLRGRSMLDHDPDRALPMLARAAELCGADGPPAVRLKYAEQLVQHGRLDEAEPIFRAALARDPSDPRALLGMGRVAVARGDYAAAVEWLERSVKQRPDVKAAHTLLAVSYGRLGRADAARRAQAEGRSRPENAKWHDPYFGEALGLRVGKDAQLERATDLLNAGDPAEAARLLREVIAAYPDADRAHVKLGAALVASGAAREAEAVLRSAVERWPGVRDLRNELGRALFAQERFDEAEAVFREVLRDDPDLGETWFNVGQCRAKQDDWRGAADAFRRTIRAGPELVAAHVDLGVSLLQLDRPGEAVGPLTRALQLDPEEPRAAALLREAQRLAKGRQPY